MPSEESPRATEQSCTPIELLSVLGFGLGIAWMLLVCFWMFSAFPGGCNSTTRDFAQLFVFAGMAVGFAALHFAGKHAAFNLFSLPVLVAQALVAALLPLCACLQLEGVAIPLALVCLVAVAAGVACSCIVTSWLDICSRLKTKLYGRFIGMSFVLGAVLFFVAAQNQAPMHMVFGVLYVLASVAFLAFANSSLGAGEMRIPVETVAESWGVSRAVAPSFLMFNATFGMAFNWLFNMEPQVVSLGLLSVIPAALCIAVLSWRNIRVDITALMRVLLCLCVFACVFMSQVASTGKTVCSCLIIFAWTMFMALNYSFSVKKSVVTRDAPLFRQAPQRFFIHAVGFAAGWGVILLGAWLFGDGSDALVLISLAFAVLLVVVFVLFFPPHVHYDMDGGAEATSENPLGLDSQELFTLQVRCVARGNLLSPRETDVFQYLAHGRNAAYIQQKLVISPCTVKSHIYNIYRKLDVHSQQELIDMVENYVVEPSDYDLKG